MTTKTKPAAKKPLAENAPAGNAAPPAKPPRQGKGGKAVLPKNGK